MVKRRVAAVSAILPLALASGCLGTSVKPNIVVDMTRGSTATECTEIARYNVESGQKIYSRDKDNPADGHHDLEVQLAVIKDAADQLRGSDPVRLAALRYVAHGTTHPYFQPCRTVMNLADVGKLPN